MHQTKDAYKQAVADVQDIQTQPDKAQEALKAPAAEQYVESGEEDQGGASTNTDRGAVHVQHAEGWLGSV